METLLVLLAIAAVNAIAVYALLGVFNFMSAVVRHDHEDLP